MKLIELNMDRIIALCQKCRVVKLWVFGSILSDRFNANSDIDFSVNFDSESIYRDNLDYADIFFCFVDGLREILCREIDIVFDDNIVNPYFRKELDATKVLIYG